MDVKMNNSSVIEWELTEKCQACQGYLSVAPILNIDNLPLCGRCAPKHLDISVCRNYSYESLVKDLIFPCQYNSFGCKECFAWNTAEKHELSCEFEPIKCPAINCNEMICKKNIRDHFFKFHQNLIMTKRQIDMSSTETEASSNVNKIFDYNGNIGIFRKRYNEGCILINISFLDKPSALCFIKVIGDNNSSIFYIHHVTKYVQDDSIEMDLFCSIPHENQINAHLIFVENSFGKYIIPDRTRLKHLYCEICFENKQMNFAFCSNSHTVCSDCFESIRHIEDIEKPCPYCRCPLDIYIPCKYKEFGCSAFSYASKISQHESKCPFLPEDNVFCLLSPKNVCNWMGRKCDVAQHMTLEHPGNFLIASKPITAYLSHLSHKFFIMQFGDNLFELFLHYERKTGLNIKIESSNPDAHQYFLEFDSTKGHMRSDRFSVSKRQHSAYNLVACSKIVTRFLTKECLIFTINIVKV